MKRSNDRLCQGVDTWIDIAELKRRHWLDDVIEALGHPLTSPRGGIRRGWHCDHHRDEQELTVFLNRDDDAYFVCNRCGLRGDVIAWVGDQLFGDGHNPRNYQQLQEIAKYLKNRYRQQVDARTSKSNRHG